MTLVRTSASYEGPAIVELLPDGRRVQLAKEFAYVDSANLRWHVPAGAIADGASIPRVLWTFIGGPLDGLYRDASIIHDWYCDLRIQPWWAVHRVFYEAMLTSGVPLVKAQVMYAGVYGAGPRWSETVVSNTRLVFGGGRRETPRQKRPASEKKLFAYQLSREDFAPLIRPHDDLSGEAQVYRRVLTESDLRDLQETIEQGALDLGDIERLVDSKVQAFPSGGEFVL